ncbi:16S rRNA (adenine(1518)-N(6)/adenine(1519)-N(6))-dimethyltransferase RsmA [Archaeoglobus sulfaticallidus]|uniref:16S rRNA (adenine(1518)-N(6)/adenine(1519)-N(6))- dimethyltransferase RsmA n=1 Tax=Archaeoglobus sulfaticallidus TaxID=1316941 RepID=UPI001F00BC50|nr:16S rRNA (adenine(1518)-N(6)/adenine(1519)-N(6))-dimethyltransferase RsmA [Archaeoglobus sulfaticallidus]
MSKSILYRIIQLSELKEDETVLEVGCGTGNLTELLLRNSGKVIGIEKDARFVRYLRSKFYDEIREGKFRLIHGDALRINFPRFDKFISNIPYSISTPLTFKLLESKFDLAIITYQQEFAERLTAREGEKSYGRISVAVKAYCRVKILFKVPRTAFRPIPKVDSAVVKLIPKPEIEVKDVDVFNDLLRTSFSMKRKLFGKVLKEWLKKYDAESVIDEFEEYLDLRPDHIPPEVYARIADMVSENG